MYVCARVRACVRACVRVRACMYTRAHLYTCLAVWLYESVSVGGLQGAGVGAERKGWRNLSQQTTLYIRHNLRYATQLRAALTLRVAGESDFRALHVCHGPIYKYPSIHKYLLSTCTYP